MIEHYCDCCGHVHGDLEVYEKVKRLEATNAELLEALERLIRADDKGFINLKNFRKGTQKAIQKAKS